MLGCPGGSGAVEATPQWLVVARSGPHQVTASVTVVVVVVTNPAQASDDIAPFWSCGRDESPRLAISAYRKPQAVTLRAQRRPHRQEP